GDYRSGNYLHEDRRITAILDWEMAHLGDPMEDLGWACMRFWSGGGRVAGLLERGEVFRAYEAAGGVAVDRRRGDFYETPGAVKMTVICMPGVRSMADGRASDSTLELVGFLIPRLLEELARRLGVMA